MFSQEEVNKIVQTAHRLNKKVSAHISTSMHVHMAIAGDVDDLAHMAIDYVPNSVIFSVIEQDIYWVPTLELWELVSERHNLIWNEIALDNLIRFNSGGGKVAMGTDFGGYDVDFELGMPMVEIQLMLQAGMCAMEIILSATKNAAIVCDKEDELGTIEVGKIADIIVVKKDPLEDLQVLSDVQIVIHNGKIVKYQR
jgi:imidazolonepropionase-like amidohydrolase